jgi:hypothetical protein
MSATERASMLCTGGTTTPTSPTFASSNINNGHTDAFVSINL